MHTLVSTGVKPGETVHHRYIDPHRTAVVIGEKPNGHITIVDEEGHRSSHCKDVLKLTDAALLDRAEGQGRR